MTDSAVVLALGDLHIQPDNLADIQVYLKQLEKFLNERKGIDLIIIMGDTLHTHEIVYSQCMNMMLEYIWLCQRFAPTYVLVGNHEYVNNQAFLNDNHPFVGWKETYNIVDRVTDLRVKGKSLVLSPYVPDGRFHEALNTLAGDWKTSDCIFAHQLLDGAKMGAITAKGVEEWKLDYPMLVCGHIHDQQDPQPNLHYTGSSIQVSFGEREDHTASIVTIGDKVSIEKVNIHPPTKRTVYADIAQVRDMKIPEEENTKVKLSISGDAEDFKTFKKTQQYKDLTKRGVKVVFKQKRKFQPELPVTQQRGFSDILFELVEKDPKMVDLYNQVLGQTAAASDAVNIVFDDGPEIVFED